MRKLFPRLPTTVARRLAEELVLESITALGARAATSHPMQEFAPTGGVAITEDRLAEIAAGVRALAEKYDYPAPRRQQVQDAFDSKLAAYLHANTELDPAEASSGEVWNFFGCVLLPDVACWRFGRTDDAADAERPTIRVERLLGGDRGQRNAFGRLWWRAQLLRAPSGPLDPYALLYRLGEDEFQGIVERGRAVGSPRVARALALALVDVHAARPKVARMDVARDGFKRFGRLAAIASIDALPDDELEALCRRLFEESLDALLRHKEEASA